ncbi:hypothetical protein HOLleu_29444 [Holothuria leucospilota]|uniref:Protein quiver n=1 Tax=Holothuria leucospilota TaxID=206669 RepID=A0A9Q1BNT6_HOLLE|nr:hypothetical protein HOLleu_29444 [Holothuria leucospilota]
MAMVQKMPYVLFFCLIFFLHTVTGLQCYRYETLECQWNNNLYQAACDDLENINKPPSAATVQQCTETEDRCFMVISTGENNNVGVSSISGECTSAADLGWGTTDCRNAINYQEHDVLGWHVKRGQSFGTDLTSAKVCVCDTELCNGQTSQMTLPKLGLYLTLMISVWLII